MATYLVRAQRNGQFVGYVSHRVQWAFHPSQLMAVWYASMSDARRCVDYLKNKCDESLDVVTLTATVMESDHAADAFSAVRS